MQTFQLKKRPACSFFPEDPRVGFALLQGDAGESFTVVDEQMNTVGFLLEGSLAIDYGAKRDIIIGPATMFLLPRGISHELKILEPSMGLRLYLGSNLGLCEDVISSQTPSNPSNSIDKRSGLKFKLNHLPIMPIVVDFLQQLKEYIQDGLLCSHINDFKYKEFCMLMGTYYDHHQLYEFFAPMLTRNRSFRESVLENYQNDSTIESLASTLCMSRSSFIRYFKDSFGETPHQWILRKKAMKIKWELQQSDSLISDICYRYGFSSPAQFTTFCKKYLELAPKYIQNTTKIDKINHGI